MQDDFDSGLGIPDDEMIWLVDRHGRHGPPGVNRKAAVVSGGGSAAALPGSRRVPGKSAGSQGFPRGAAAAAGPGRRQEKSTGARKRAGRQRRARAPRKAARAGGVKAPRRGRGRPVAAKVSARLLLAVSVGHPCVRGAVAPRPHGPDFLADRTRASRCQVPEPIFRLGVRHLFPTDELEIRRCHRWRRLAGLTLARRRCTEAPHARVVCEKRRRPVPGRPSRSANHRSKSARTTRTIVISRRCSSAITFRNGPAVLFPFENNRDITTRRAWHQRLPAGAVVSARSRTSRESLLDDGPRSGASVLDGCSVREIDLGTRAPGGRRHRRGCAHGDRAMDCRFERARGSPEEEARLRRPVSHAVNACWFRFRCGSRWTTGRTIRSGARVCPSVSGGSARTT